MFLYINFESHYALERVLPILRILNKQHLLVVVFFENDEISDFTQKETGISIDKIFTKTIADEFIMDKLKIRQELMNLGIQCILTKPADLTINTLNKYLELKARGMI